MAEDNPPISASLAARYAVIETLGEGAMGVVYRAVQVTLDRPVALKVIRPQMLNADGKSRFLQEARLAARINHPNVVQVYESGEDGEVPFIAFELVNGSSLRSQLDAGVLDDSVSVAYAKQVASGLAAAHDQGIIHRDVKPENILITRAGDAKVADFGISRPAQADRPGLTAVGTILGSPLYMSPEQAANRPLTAATDQYSLGVVLYEMLVGRPPFAGSTAEILAQHLRDTISLPPAVRARVAAHVVEVLETMVRKAPERRFPHARDVAASLDKALTRWRGPRKSTIPTLQPRVPGFAREGATSGSGTAALDPGSMHEPVDSPRASGARSGARGPARSGTGGASRISMRASRIDDESAFDSEPLPMSIRVGFLFLILASVSAIAFWAGRKERPSAARETTQPSISRPERSRTPWPEGTIVGNVHSKIYHVVGTTQADLPAREKSRTFDSVEAAERAGYRRSRR